MTSIPGTNSDEIIKVPAVQSGPSAPQDDCNDRGFQLTITLRPFDALVFTSVSPSIFANWTALKYVVSTAGYLDRAVPKPEEFEASIGRLGRAGMVRVKGSRFGITGRGAKLVKQHQRPSRGVIEHAMLLGEAWDGLTVDEINPEFEFHLGVDEWESAVREYGLPLSRRGWRSFLPR